MLFVTYNYCYWDCLSPLLFNLCVNSLINTIKDERIHCLGYVNDVSLRPRHWFQFADDAAIISAHNEDNQLLCNAFSKWSSWADLYIRVNKCHTFGIKKFGSRAVQYPPIIKISGQLVPPIEDGESFMYLGKQFNFKMDCSNIKVEILDELQAYLKKIDILPINPFHKIRVVQRYVYSKFCWRFSVYPLTISWVRSHKDSLISKYIRKWLQIPISGNISHLKFPKSQLGIDFCSISDIYNQCRVTVRRILKTSVNPEIQQLYTKTSSQNIVTDDIIERAAAGISEQYEMKNAAKKIVEKENLAKIWSNFVETKEKSVIITSITDCCYKMLIKLWHDIVCRMPSNIICFARRSLILSLGNNSNLRRWNIRDSAGCDLCQKMQTQRHIFSNCKVALEQGRYTWRHDSILLTIIQHFKAIANEDLRLFVDCPNSGTMCSSTLFQTSRPDLVVDLKGSVYVVELTVPYETNCKEERYKHLRSELIMTCRTFEVITLEVTTLGFVSKDIDRFRTLLRAFDLNDERIIRKCM